MGRVHPRDGHRWALHESPGAASFIEIREYGLRANIKPVSPDVGRAMRVDGALDFEPAVANAI